MTISRILFNQELLDKKENFSFLLKEYTFKISEQSSDRTKLCLSIYKDNNVIGFFFLSPIPHCCGSLFLSSIQAIYNGNKVGHLSIALAIRIAEVLGYSSLDCIIPKYQNDRCTSWNKATHLVLKSGFKELKSYEVKNARTNNLLKYYQKKIILENLYKYELDSSPFIPEDFFIPTYKKGKVK